MSNINTVQTLKAKVDISLTEQGSQNALANEDAGAIKTSDYDPNKMTKAAKKFADTYHK